MRRDGLRFFVAWCVPQLSSAFRLVDGRATTANVCDGQKNVRYVGSVLTGKFVDKNVEFEFPRVGEVFCDFCSWE